MQKYKYVTLEAANYCNARCKWCKTGRKNRIGGVTRDKFLQLETAKKGVEYMLRHSMIEKDAIVELFNWGEAFFNPQIKEILQVLCASGLRIGLSTNASRYIEIPKEYMANIEYLIISISGFAEKSYKNIHELNLKTVLDNASKFSDWFNSNGYFGKIIMNFHVYQYNMREMKDAEKFAHDHHIIFSPHIAYLADESLMLKYLNNSLDGEVLRDASKEILFGMIEQIKEKVDGQDFICPQKERLVLDENLNIVPCCLFNTEEAIGSLFEFENVYEIKEKLETWDYCSECIRLKQAQIITSPLMQLPYQSSLVQTKFYYADGGGEFSEEQTILGGSIVNGEEFNIEIIIPKGSEYVRFDPLEGKKSIMMGLQFIYNEETLLSEWNNGITVNEQIMFETTDPQILIKLPPKEGTLKIQGKCIWY